MRSRIFVSALLLLTLLIAATPMSLSAAQASLQTTPPFCPPVDPSLLSDPNFASAFPKECLEKYNRIPDARQSPSGRVSILAAGGPDDFGYIFDDTAPFNWISATTNSGLTGDDNAMSVTPGFDFPFYGYKYSQLFFSTNGLITFDQSACCVWGGITVPSPASPNNFIAPFWEDLLVGSPYNTGGIFYEIGGVAPSRFIVIEWRDVKTFGGSNPFSFEAILHENGDIIFLFQSLPLNYFSTVGIENKLGDDGLAYQTGGFFGGSGFSAPRAVLFTFPPTPAARVSVSPINSGTFASASADLNFSLQITNIGTMGTDAYNLSATSSWPVTFYQDGCLAPLTDTNADSVIDSGPIPESASATVCISFTPTAGSGIGDENPATITVTSSIDSTKSKTTSLGMAIPSDFVQVLKDFTDSSNVFMTTSPDNYISNHVTSDFYFANGLATIDLPDGRYVYVWRKPDGNFQNSFSDIEFTILEHDGIGISVPNSKLTSNIGAGQTYDFSPAVAAAQDGTIGVVWYRWLVDSSTNLLNYNVYFATISSAGSLLSGPVNITNNFLTDRFNNINVPHYFSPAIAATDDNRFILSWQDYRTDGGSTFTNNIWYSTIDPNGNTVFSPAALTSNGSSYNPILNPTTGNNSILSWVSNRVPYFAVIDSNGSFFKAATALPGTSFSSTDAVTLPNGSTAIAWTTTDPSVAYVILDNAYNTVSGPASAANPLGMFNTHLSITYDSSNRIIMTWANDDSFPTTHLFYALADDAGTFITNPTQFRTSSLGVITSENGQGNAPHITAPSILAVSIDIKPNSARNRIEIKPDEDEEDDDHKHEHEHDHRYGEKVSVAILSTAQFNAIQQVDRTSLTFGSTGDENSLNFKGRKQVADCRKKDVNRDGLSDLVCKFRVNKTGFKLGDTMGYLKGVTVNGLAFEGSDVVLIEVDD
ncbi:MAG: hypothetical protein HY864_00130 [Chloroflexi bacterium]|nr:hypothetical protein [Chloroflexota bacterium]